MPIFHPLPSSVKNQSPTVAIFQDPESGACAICKVAVATVSGFCLECEATLKAIWATIR